MSTKKFDLLLIGIIGLISVQFQCNKRLDCANTVYSFELGVKAYPDKDSINVGDTIWLEINEPTTLKDAFTGQMIDYSGAANLGSFIGFSKLVDSVPKWIDAATDFDFKLIKGQEVINPRVELGREYNFIEEANRYKFLFGVVPTRKGVYSLVFSNASNVYRAADKCTKASFAINFNNTDRHYYLSPFYMGRTSVGGDYYFKVY